MDFWLVLTAGAMVANYYLARHKGSSVGLWVILGFIFGFFSTIFLALVPSGEVKCTYCAEMIRPDARICRHCGRERA